MVALGEGNASLAAGEGAFLVTASGVKLRDVQDADIVEIDPAPTLTAIETNAVEGSAVHESLAVARQGGADRRPSVEAPLHAVCLAQPGVACVAHTHPTAINAITCSAGFEHLLAGRLFHDEIVVCGPEPVLLPFIDSGVPLARAVRVAIAAYADRHGEAPKTIYLQNHGFVALGATPQEVQAITEMAVKSARVRLGAAAAGGVHPLAPADVNRIAQRPDERYRGMKLCGESPDATS